LDLGTVQHPAPRPWGVLELVEFLDLGTV